MSKYYNIKGLKVRISDHEPNFGAPGRSSDIELYVKSACDSLLSVVGQLEHICEKRGLDINDFQQITEEWQDGMYDKNVFSPAIEEEEKETCDLSGLTEFRRSIREDNKKKLEGHTLPRFASHKEIKALSEKTGVSQSFIKKHFCIL